MSQTLQIMKMGEQIADLEKENKTLEGCILAEQEHTQILEKENAELKSELKEIKKRILPQDMCELMAEVKENYDNKVKAEQLTKAKEIIKNIEKIFYSGEEALKRLSKISDILEQAEQFLEKVK